MLKQYHHIQVAVDGSKEAEMAFGKAVEVAKRNEAELEILHVVDTRAFQDVSSFDSAMVEQVSKEAQAKIEEYYKQAKDAGVKDVKYSIEFGSPKNIIAHEFPKKHNIDLIIIGATGLNAVERLLIGSITEYVTRTSSCDVLVIREPAAQKQDIEKNTKN
ncbi:universal stress protein [Lactobacillus hominis]|uniref:Universal stress protein n=1 Tax=Lactobacillus hominis DSM 23910 = CRBIP 24.179 TaxID=1423758 RepID=I7L8R8_9LACO|nr:universal stress protein [Lactobacillus hominis]KRM86162.1 universal stress protein [Lactobacillus hominis DSM 23910 = CRBIP 24.179]MCT3348615.1 universal stress protein [Lactobacillus hominis]CCI80879.1 Putative universal stress protein [Lactobacillus hominis DSM 23910 = CRBIP 24.179]